MDQAATQAMTVRRMNFAFTPDMERVFVKDDPDTSYTFLGTWMMLPYLEPYLIRTMRQALPHIREPQLKEDLKRFCAQEGEHFKQHAIVNDMIRDLVPGFAALKPIDDTGELAASLLKKVGHTGESVNAVKRKAANSLGVAHEIDGVTEAQKMAQSSFLTQPGFA